jgi:hypothetical protein
MKGGALVSYSSIKVSITAAPRERTNNQHKKKSLNQQAREGIRRERRGVSEGGGKACLPHSKKRKKSVPGVGG